MSDLNQVQQETEQLTITYTEYPRGKSPIKRVLVVPNDQWWLHKMLDEQTMVLRSIRTAVWIVAVFIIISVIIAIQHL
ncbi:MAG: hypothetical protein ABSB41_06010 [Anaerolineales bacterium]|jgi:hypothetical protein